MKSFGQFDLIAYVAPGALVIIAIASTGLLRKSDYGDATLAIAFAIAAYATGHIIAGMGAAAELVFLRRSGIRGYGRESGEWLMKHLATDQLERFRQLVRVRLNRTVEPDGTNVCTPDQWKNVARQIYIDVSNQGRAKRVDTFNLRIP